MHKDYGNSGSNLMASTMAWLHCTHHRKVPNTGNCDTNKTSKQSYVKRASIVSHPEPANRIETEASQAEPAISRSAPATSCPEQPNRKTEAT